ncbi:MAG: hypothetical protein GX640_18035 [Fibrobacter sp.]|nr:hypothetical protein [Fibrobacter sp.]
MKFPDYCVILIFMLYRCSGPSVVTGDGGATETVNAQVIITDTIISVKIDSDTLISADIMLFDINYNPAYQSGYKDSVHVTSKDTIITYKANPGIYNLLILTRENNKSLAVKNLNPGTGKQEVINDTLTPNGAIQGKIITGAFSNDNNIYFKLYITGTPFFTEVSNENFELSGIPAGTYHLEISMCSNDRTSDKNYSKILGRDIDVIANDTTTGIELFISN